MYTKKQFGTILKAKIATGISNQEIAEWAFEIYNRYELDFEKNLDQIVLQLVAMGEGPEFFLSKKELLSLANELTGETEGSPCPCCGFLTISKNSHDTLEVCPICNWKDNEAQFRHPNLSGGTNEKSLNEAKEHFNRFKASSINFTEDFHDLITRKTKETQVRKILNTEWDPIQISHEVPDGYDSYIPEIMFLLEKGVSAEEIYNHLHSIEMTHFEKPGKKTHLAAKKLFTLTKELQ